MHERWKKVSQRSRDEKFINWLENHPWSWVEESEDDDDIFMPSITAKRAASSKGKSGPSTEAGGCVDGR